MIGLSLEADGKTPEPANHQYDTDDFFAAVKAGNFPSVSFIKAPAFQDGHAGYSDPLDEQAFTAKIVNFLQQQPDWETTAVIVAWDDSDGWYDHAYAVPTTSVVRRDADQVNGAGKCGTGTRSAGCERRTGEWPLRSGHAYPVPRDLAVGQGELRGPHADQPGFGGSLHRRQLAERRASRRRFVRRHCRRINSMFNFSGSHNAALYLDPATGTPVYHSAGRRRRALKG